MVLDVYIDLGKKLVGAQQQQSRFSLAEPSVRSLNTANSSVSSQNITPPPGQPKAKVLEAQPHLLVGVFTSETERQPSNLELGLFTWLSFTRTACAPLGEENVRISSDLVSSSSENTPTIPNAVKESGILSNNLERKSVAASSSSVTLLPTSSLPTGQAGGSDKRRPGTSSEDIWSPTKSDSGVSSWFHSLLGTEASFECRLVCATPSKAYVDKTVSLKVRSWLGVI